MGVLSGVVLRFAGLRDSRGMPRALRHQAVQPPTGCVNFSVIIMESPLFTRVSKLLISATAALMPIKLPLWTGPDAADIAEIDRTGLAQKEAAEA